MPQFTVEHIFNAPLERVFSELDTHKGLQQLLWPMELQTCKPSIFINQSDGLGSERTLGFGALRPLRERVTVFIPNERIEYELVDAPLVKHHQGTLSFQKVENNPLKTKVIYTIELLTQLPFLASPILMALRYSIQNGFRKLDQKLQNN